jgi:RimJ/RimL family protein N-acetyltransferase
MSEPLPIPVIAGQTVRLRPHVDADLAPILERCVHPETVRWTTVPSPYTPEMAQEYLGHIMTPSPAQISWAIEVGGRYAGTIDLRLWATDLERPSGNLGFVTHPDLRGRGVMSEAIGLAVAHAFDTLGWEHVTWQANVGNYASCKSAWRNGFPLPLLVPALLKHRGAMVDAWHAVLEPDMPREPVTPWDEVCAVLDEHVRTARRPG